MSIAQPDDRGWYSFERRIDRAAVDAMRQVGAIAQLSVTDIPRITRRHARLLRTLPRVERLWLWSDTSRLALSDVVRLPGLRMVDVFALREPGRLRHFERARSLEALRCNLFMREDDLLAIARCETLRELGAQGAGLTRRALDALLSLPDLHTLDLEATRFDDAMARRVSRSATITSLDLGRTRITRDGLRHLVAMPQLRALDLWATPLSVDDLELLRALPELESLTVGHYDEDCKPDGARLVPLLLQLPALRRVWLDGAKLDAAQRALLEQKLEHVRLT